MINLTLTDEQAKIVAAACEFYARIKLGQFTEIVWHTLDMKIPSGEYCKRRDAAENLLYEAREHIYPDLYGRGHSYGVGKFEDVDRAYDVYQVIRYALGDHREPYSRYDLPKCEFVKED